MITNEDFDEIKVGHSDSSRRQLTKQYIDISVLLSGDMKPT
jgi:hypothetical protein